MGQSTRETSFNQARLRRFNEAPVDKGREYVLYWSQIYRRLHRNHALDYAARCAVELGKPLVIYEGLRLRYPWASERIHAFVLEGMADNRARAARLGLNYWPYVETDKTLDRKLLKEIADRAALVVTDDYPSFTIPRQTAGLVRSTTTPVFGVDGNSIVPLSLLGAPVSAAAHLRPRIHKLFAEAWMHRAAAMPRLSTAAQKPVDAPFDPWAGDVPSTLARLSFEAVVPPVRQTLGGSSAARRRLEAFVGRRLRGYAEDRSTPRSLETGHASGLSPYVHFGHIAIEEVVESALATTGDWTTEGLCPDALGKREGFFGADADVNSFLDEAITWRDVGLQWHWSRCKDTSSLETALPAWALDTLRSHAHDKRAFVYTAAQWEAGEIHDPLWNAAQKELRVTGTIHNYLRMLWGKKVIEWSRTPEEAYRTLVHLNNKYAIDGRDPNSYTGILWCFGLFDRPWAPERKVLGSIRYMSSDNTAKKFKLGPYLDYVNGLA